MSAALGVVFLAVGERGRAAFPGQNGRIAFVATVGGNDEIYTMAADGSNVVNLTNNAANDTQPAWSADGQQLLFTSDRSGKERIYSMPVGGGPAELKTLLPGNPQESSPAFGPDGRITWETTLHGGYEIYVQGTDGQPKRLTNNDPVSDRAPAWSPDGRQIAFWSARNQNRDIFVIDADGSNLRQLTTYNESDRDPVWSPDGTKIAFERTIGSNSEIFVMSATGANQVNLTNNPADDRNAAWSPDGMKITFRSSRSKTTEIYVMDAADGKNVMPLTMDDSSEDDPDWQPAPADRDGDALLDEWETKGYNPDGKPPVEVDLPKMGADPMRKDVFVELDSMPGHQLSAAALKKVIDAFAAAAVPTTGGLKPGIALHVDNGPDSIMDPTTGARWGSLSKGTRTLQHVPVLGSYRNGAYSWAVFDRVKEKAFSEARRRIFHYAISAHRIGDPDAREPLVGFSREEPASDLVLGLALGCPPGLDCAGTTEQQAGSFMHELGHNLGLGDGGVDALTLKPNHISVMNYLYAGGIGYDGELRFDYSRFDAPTPDAAARGARTIATLDESSVDEGAGLGFRNAPDSAKYDLMVFCRKGSTWELERLLRKDGDTTADWNCNGRIDDGPVRLSLNSDDRFEVLRSADEWRLLTYGGGAIGAKLTAVLPATTPGTDVPKSQLVASARVLLRDRKAPTVQIAGPRRARGPVRLIVTARDDKGLALVVVTIDGKSYQLPVSRTGQKVFRAAATVVRRGNRVVRAGALDRAGGRSKTVVARVRVR
jgi:Tol biopolymer transport system component